MIELKQTANLPKEHLSMRRTIVLTAAAVLLAAGIAVSQQPPGGGSQPNSPLPPRPDAGGGAPNFPDGGYVVVATPPGALATNPYAQAGYGGWGGQPPMPYDAELGELHRLDHELEQESRKLVNQLAQSPENDAEARDQLKAKLRETLDKQFDAQLKLRETEVARIEERVKKLRDVINKRSAARKAIVDRRQQQLIDDAEGLGWSPSGGAGAADPFSAAHAPGMPVPIWDRQIRFQQKLPPAATPAARVP